MISFWILLYTLMAGAKTNELDLFSKCHFQFINAPASISSPLYTDVQDGKLSGVEGCMKLIESVNTTRDGLSAATPTAQAVLNTFHNLHASWFLLQQFTTSKSCIMNSLQQIYDPSTPALYYSMALLDSSKTLDYAITSTDSLYPLRDEQKGKDTYFGKKPHLFTYRSPSDRASLNAFGFKGRLTGIQKDAPHIAVRASPFGLKEIYKSYGMGFLGNPTYMIRSILLPPGRKMRSINDGGRLTSMELMHDLLCIDLPSVHVEDSQPFVKLDGAPYEKSAECMRCHTTIDPLGESFRNFMLLNTRDHCVDEIEPSMTILHHFEERRSLHREFHESASRGKLYFRDFENRLVSIPYESLQDFPKIVASSPQFYFCSASRYFKFLTGIDTLREDSKNRGPRDYIKKLTLEYTQHKNPRAVIREILQSEYYR